MGYKSFAFAVLLLQQDSLLNHEPKNVNLFKKYKNKKLT